MRINRRQRFPIASAAWARRISWTQGHFFVFHNPEWIFHPEIYLLYILNPSNILSPLGKESCSLIVCLEKKVIPLLGLSPLSIIWDDGLQHLHGDKPSVIVTHSQLYWLLSHPYSVISHSDWRMPLYPTSHCTETITYLWSFLLPFFGFAIGLLRWLDLNWIQYQKGDQCKFLQEHNHEIHWCFIWMEPASQDLCNQFMLPEQL